MKYILALFALINCFIVSTPLLAQNPSHEQMNSTMSMVPLPMRIGFNGQISWGYMLKPMGMNGSMNGNMNGNMNNGMNSSMMNMPSWMYSFMPMLSLSGDFYRRLINLEKSNTNNDNLVQINDYSQKYLAIENKSITLGAGGGFMAMPMGSSIPMFGFRASLTPYKGGHLFKAKHIQSKDEISLLDSMHLPKNVQDLASWEINDHLSYSSRGGVMFGAGVGMSIYVAIMQTYMAEGQFITSVRKVSETEVMVSLRKSKIHMFAQKINNALVELKTGQMKSVDKGFNFIFDLNQEESKKIYHEFLKGSVLAAQYAVKENISGVEMLKTTRSSTWGNSRSLSYGVPFLYNGTFIRAKMYTHSQVINGFTGGKMKAHMSMYKKAHETDGRLSSHKSSGFLFMGMANTSAKKYHPHYGGSFKWYFQKDQTSHKFFKRQLKRLLKVFGTDSVTDLALPNLTNMGFVKAEVDFMLTKKDIDRLLVLSEKNDIYQSMYDDAYKQMNTYFSLYQNTKNYCGHVLNFALCKKKAYRQSWKHISAISYLLEEMNHALKLKDLQAFAKTLGKLGKHALSNRFVFKSLIKAMDKKSSDFLLKIQGSRVLKTKLTI